MKPKNAKIFKIPIEIFAYEIVSFLDHDSRRTFYQICQAFRSLKPTVESVILQREKQLIVERREAFLKEKKRWMKIRSSLSKDEKDELDRDFKMKIGNDMSGNDLLEIYKKGGSGVLISEGELDGGDNYASFFRDILDFRTRLELVEVLINNMKIQLAAGTSLKFRSYLGNGGSPIEDYYASYIGGYLNNVFDIVKTEKEIEEYFSLVLEGLRILRDAGMQFKSEHLIEFIKSCSFQKYYNLSKVLLIFPHKKYMSILKKKMKKLVRFLILNGCDPLEVVKHKYYSNEKDNSITMAWKKGNSFLVGEIISDMKESDYKRLLISLDHIGIHKIIKSLSGNNSGKKVIKLLISNKHFRKGFVSKFDFVKELMRVRERRVLKLCLKLENELIKNVSDSEGNTLLHFATTVRGKTCRIIEMLLNFGLNVNSKNKQKDTPIMNAIRIKHWEVIRLLLFYKADLSIVNTNNESPMDLILQNKWLIWKIGIIRK